MDMDRKNSEPKDPVMFTSKKIGNVTIKNRLVRSATFESAANDDGTVGAEYTRIYQPLSRGEIGLIITGMISVSDAGKSYHKQAGLHTDAAINGFAAMNDNVHQDGANIFAQLCHGGRQTYLHGLMPKAPSRGRPDLIYKVIPSPMTAKDIAAAIKAFADAALRAKKAGFDGIQLHGAHGYLISEFLSPFFNNRRDEWGGNPGKRFRFLERVYEAVRTATGPEYPVTIKINSCDYTPKPGLQLEESAQHIERLIRMGIDAVEISCGTMAFSLFHSSRGGIPAKGFSRTLPLPFQPLACPLLKLVYPEKAYRFEEGYNLQAAEYLKTVMQDTPLILVGGLRSPAFLNRVIQDGKADFVSLCRPFIREPLIAKKWQAGEWKQPTCINCNKCYVGLAMQQPLQCNQKKDY